jgi:hypothetical protein
VAVNDLALSAVAVNDLALSALATVDVGDANGDRLDRLTVDGTVEAFVANCVGKVAAHVGDLHVEPEVADVGKPRCDQRKM